MLTKIISGGQTGADQAGLDVAIKLNIPHGGWIPKGRLTEDGPLAERYNLQEMPSDNYSKRTEQNVIDSDGTVIFSHGKLTGGSAYTGKMAEKHSRPMLHVDMDKMSVQVRYENGQRSTVCVVFIPRILYCVFNIQTAVNYRKIRFLPGG